MPIPPFLQSLRSRPVVLARLLIAIVLVLEVLIIVKGPSAWAAKREIAEAVAKGDTVAHWEPEADIGIHYAAVINAVLLVVLGVLAPLWTRPFVAPLEDDPLVRPKRPLWQRIVLPVALVAGFASVYGLTSFASKSLWWDEMWAMKQCSHGTWKEDKKNDGELKFQPTTWKRCAFYYQKPTNHPAASVAQKASLTVWHKLTGAKPEAFSELAARMPALIASGIAVLLLMQLIGAGKGIAVGAFLLMLHPWHLRYGVEMRGYVFIVPLCVSGILATRKVIFTRGRSVRAWTWLGLNQAVWIWNYPTSALDVAVLFATLAVFLWRGEETTRDRFTAMIRLVVAHAFAAALCLQLFLPNFIQTRHWAGKEDQGHELDPFIAKDTLSFITLGSPWKGHALDQPEGAGLTGVVDHFRSEPLAWAMIALMLGLSAAGLAWALKNQPRTGWLLIAPVISALAYAGISTAFGSYFYPRFIISVLPVFIAGLALCGQVFSVWTQMQRRIVLAVMVAFVALTLNARGVLMSRPYSGFKEASQLVQALSSKPKKPLVICYGLGREVVTVYYRDTQPAANAADVAAARDKAKAEGRDLLVMQGYTIFNRARAADGMKLLDDRKQFEELAVYPGIEPDFLFRVLKAK